VLFNFRDKRFRILIIVFITFYGLTMVTDAAGDSSRHAERFASYISYTFSDFWTSIKNVVTRKSDFHTDIYLLASNFFVSRFTDQFRYVFALHAFVFAVFYIGSLSHFKDELSSMSKNSLFFLLFLIITYSITKIGFVRYPIATWIFFYGVIGFLYQRSLLYLGIVLISATVHFSYVFVIFPFLLVILVGPRKYLYLGVLIFSLLTPDLMYGQFSRFDAREAEIGRAYERKLTG